MQYSPKLKKAMAEIDAIIKKYDINGVVVLHEPGFGEYKHYVDASWSCARLERGEMRFRTKGLDKTPGQKRQLLANTANFCKIMADILGREAINYIGATRLISEMVGAEHGPGTHSSQDEIDN